MSETDLEERLDAVERALTDDDTNVTDLRETAALTSDIERLETRIDDLEATVGELEAAVEAIRGYAGNVRAVNRDVERRASAALAKAETIEASLEQSDNLDRRQSHPPADDGRRTNASETAREAGRSDRKRTDRRLAEEVSAHDGTPESGRSFGAQAESGHERPSQQRPRRDETGCTRPNGTVGTDTERTRQCDGRRETTAGHSGDDEESGLGQTEQFIERVRDVL